MQSSRVSIWVVVIVLAALGSVAGVTLGTRQPAPAVEDPGQSPPAVPLTPPLVRPESVPSPAAAKRAENPAPALAASAEGKHHVEPPATVASTEPTNRVESPAPERPVESEDERTLFPRGAAPHAELAALFLDASAKGGDEVAVIGPARSGAKNIVSVARIRVPAAAPRIERRVQFVINRWEIASGSVPMLEELAAMIARHPDVQVLLGGHTDRSTGSPAWNMELSARRAASVGDFLGARGVSAARLTAVGYGSTRPRVAAETDEDARRANRRVEIVNLGSAGP